MADRVYKFRCYPPVENAELVREQMRLAHRYYNCLIEIERARRAMYRDLDRDDAGCIAARAEVAAREADVKAASLALKSWRIEGRTRKVPAELTAAKRDAQAALKSARATLREQRARLRTDPWHQFALMVLQRWANDEQKAARAASGVYWGTYQIVERAAKKAIQDTAIYADPRFRRWDGSGAVAVQIMYGEAHRGLTVSQLTACDDTRARLDLTPHERPAGKRHARRALPMLSVRVGSEGRDPVWARFPVRLHRDLPAGAAVSWVTVRVDRVAGNERWHALVTVRDAPRVESCGVGAVAVDVGWRRRPSGALRAGYWLDEGGRGGEIEAAGEIERALQKAADLRSIRDQRFDVLKVWLRERVDALPEAPEWLRDARSGWHAWKSPGRFAALAMRWRGERFEGDADAFELLEAWRRYDRHLWEWERHGAAKALRRRQDAYRNLGAMLARRYGVLVVERFDKRDTATKEGSEKGQRKQQRAAAPSELLLALTQAFAARGGKVVEVPAAWTTQACHACGSAEEFDAARNLRHACSACGDEWDQDMNACRNMLAAWAACERGGDAPKPAGARVNDYAEMRTERGSRFARARAAREGARESAVNDAESLGG